MKPKHILLFILLVATTSCVTIIKWKYGITKPREQTPQELLTFLKKHTYADSNQYIFTDSSAYLSALRNPLLSKNLFGNMIFDSSGSLIQRDTAKCQWSGYEVISALNPDSVYLMVPGLKLSEILGHIQPLVPDSGQEARLNSYDFTIVVTWAKFLGTYNDPLFELAGAANQNNTARIRMVWLNVDMQECWGLTKDQKMEIK
jgi:hypothetical protein